MLQLTHRLIRQLRVIDVTRLLQIDEGELQDKQIAESYRLRIVNANELSE